jgi:hypothetical protein
MRDPLIKKAVKIQDTSHTMRRRRMLPTRKRAETVRRTAKTLPRQSAAIADEANKMHQTIREKL